MKKNKKDNRSIFLPKPISPPDCGKNIGYLKFLKEIMKTKMTIGITKIGNKSKEI